MITQKTDLGRSVDVAVYINGKAVGGQQGATLNRQSQPINITNKITNEWQESIAGVKSWNIVCSGLYVVNDASFSLLEDAFMNNKQVEVSINVGHQNLRGRAIITDFPLSAIFNKEFKYNLRLLGTGPLA